MSAPTEMFFNDFIKLNRGFDLPENNIVTGKYPVAASTQSLRKPVTCYCHL